MRARYVSRGCAFGLALIFSSSAFAQQTDGGQPAGGTAPPGGTAPSGEAAPAGQAAEPAPPAAGQDTLPQVEVIQKKEAPPQPQPKPVAKKQAPPPEPAAEPAAEPVTEAPQTVADEIAAGKLVPMSPVGGAELPVGKYPGGVSTVPRKDFQSNGNQASQAQDVLQKYVPGIILTDSAGSNFRAQVEYRGFGAGSVTGFPQGLAVYQNGVRINEVFGDVVNWDLIPTNAISSVTIVSGNPVFGLNAIGGGISILMEDGFGFQGVEIDALGGSFGRWQVGTQVGMQSGNYAMYWAGQKIEENGFRDFSPADVSRMYADLGAKGSYVEAHVNLTWADSSAGVATASPIEILAIDWNRTFTTPQVTDLEVIMPSINASVKATDTLTFAGVGYYRNYKSDVIDGNLLDAEDCAEVAAENGLQNPFPAGTLCSEEIEDGELEALQGRGGILVNEDGVGEEPFGVIDNINQKAESWGGSVQGVERAEVFGHDNQFLLGTSYDRGWVRYGTASEIGTIGKRYVVTGSGIFLVAPDDFAPRDVDVDTEYWGIYFSDTLNLTDRLAVTVGGRFNNAQINLVDLSGNFPDITSDHSFSRFNPNAGATYEWVPGLTMYGGYSEANRAPTPAELACADPENPCPIESFLTDDPPLEQVVTDTWEFGFRGDNGGAGGHTLTWNAGLFRALNSNDILFVSSSTTGRGFFLNAGDTLRQGVEAGVNYSNSLYSVYANYAFVHATFETPNEFSSPNNPAGFPCTGDPEATCINVQPGDIIPGIPEHRFKAGFEYWLTPQWKFGADLVSASGQYRLGDESNQVAQVGGYGRVDLHTSYDVTENFQVYGIINNVFDRHYGLFGNLFDTEEATEAGEPSGYVITSPLGLVPAQPFAAYGGVKVTF